MLMLKEEMSKMGFKQLFQDDENPDGYIVTSFHYPNVPQFIFEEFVKRLSDAGKPAYTQGDTRKRSSPKILQKYSTIRLGGHRLLTPTLKYTTINIIGGYKYFYIFFRSRDSFG